MEDFKMITPSFTRWKWPNYRDMAGDIWCPIIIILLALLMKTTGACSTHTTSTHNPTHNHHNQHPQPSQAVAKTILSAPMPRAVVGVPAAVVAVPAAVVAVPAAADSIAVATATIWGSSTRFVKFSNGLNTLSEWSNRLYSLTTWYPEILKKKNDHNLPVGRVKRDIRVLGGCNVGIFVGFWLVLSLYDLAC